MTEKTVELKSAIDERLEAALATANYRITLSNQKQNARLKLQNDLTYATGGGIFKISPELISFVSTLVNMEKESMILLDSNENPIEVENLEEFLDEITSKYYESVNDFLTEFKSIQKSRNVKSLVGE